jgi:hypothetical protein
MPCFCRGATAHAALPYQRQQSAADPVALFAPVLVRVSSPHLGSE